MTKEEFKTYIFNKINVSYVINKPRSKSKVLNISQEGIKYSIGNIGNNKTVTLVELQLAYDILINIRFIPYSIFRDKLKIKSKPCNLTTIIGLLLQLKLITKIRKNQYKSNIFK